MRITAVDFIGVQVTPRTNWCFVRVAAADGVVGIGECTLSGQEALLAIEVERRGAALIGQDALQRARLARLLPNAPGGLVAHTAVSAIEQALWDIAGQCFAAPIHRLGGGALRDQVTLYANINRGVSPRNPAGFAAAATQAVAQGFTAVKLAPFDPYVWEDASEPRQHAAYAEGLARIAAVRDAVGPGVALMVDCHWRFSAGGAARLIRDVGAFGLFWLECPVAEANRAEQRRLRGLANERGMRLAGAEALSGLAAYRAVIEAECYDVLMPDVKHAGGHEEIRRIAALAQTAGIEVAPHNPTGPICHAHSLHLCATIPNFLTLEVQFGETPRFFDLVTGADLAFRDGRGMVPQAPGLAVALDEAAARALPWRPAATAWFDPRLG